MVEKVVQTKIHVLISVSGNTQLKFCVTCLVITLKHIIGWYGIIIILHVGILN